MPGLLAQIITVGAHAVGVATHATPAVHGRDLTEAYLTQPALMAHVTRGGFELAAMLNLEGLTLQRGELNAGVWGEGYVDRRHPHTYLHEAVLSYRAPLLGGAVSVAAGRGFAPFGTDDPMVRYFVKYPSNHHLAQILERLVLIGAVQGGPLIMEAGIFNGVEPASPEDLGDVDAFGDSWSARATLIPLSGVELQGSIAHVVSPENPTGGGLDHSMWNISARVARDFGATETYLLVETGETAEGKNGVDFFFYPTVLAEGSAARGPWRVAARFERSVRPEEERTLDVFRSVRPHGDDNILGTTAFTSGALQLSRRFRSGSLAFIPFVEVIRLHAEAQEEFSILPPEGIFGADRMWSFSFGIRSMAGTWHDRMGRYGAARVRPAHHHH